MFRAGGFMPKTFPFSRGTTTKPLGRYMNKVSGTDVESKTTKSGEYGKGTVLSSSYWMPDARTRIYVAEGHEGVIEDVPEDAATFKHTYWLRNVEGVDYKPHPDYLL